MMLRYAMGLMALAVAAAPPPAAQVEGRTSDSQLAIDAKLYLDRTAMKGLLDQDPGENIVVIEVLLTPAAGKKIDVSREDFLIRSDRDGQRGQAMHPSQIAGSAVLVISSTGGTQGVGMAEQRRIPYGVPGIPGGGGMPASLPGQGTPVGGSATADTSSASASVEEGKKDNPLLASLKAKVLPEGEIDKPTKGLLYFVMEGKQRPKDIELVYRKTPPRLSIRFGGKK